MKQGLEEAAERHMEVIFLEVRVSNLPAQSLYRKYNFQTVSVRQDVYELPREMDISCPGRCKEIK